MTKLTEHFALEELTRSATAYQKGINNVPDTTAINEIAKLAKDVLEPLRKAYGKPILITSGYRCDALNRAVGGAVNSQHKYGQAADIQASSRTKADNKELFDCAHSLIKQGKIKVGQLIDEYGYKWVHVSTPTAKKQNQVLHLTK